MIALTPKVCYPIRSLSASDYSSPRARITNPSYLDFELEIGVGQGRDYPVAVLRSPAGEARATMRLPFDEIQLESRLKDLQIALLRSGGTRRRALSQEEQTVVNFGRALFDARPAGENLLTGRPFGAMMNLSRL